MNWPPTTVLLCVLALILVSVAIEDARRREIANVKTAAIAVLAPAWWWATSLTAWPAIATQLGIAAALLLLFAAAFRFGWMGGGDVKLIAALALWLPFGPLAWMLVVMSLAGGALTAVMIAHHALTRREGPIEVPYGVAIALAGLLTLREPILYQFP